MSKGWEYGRFPVSLIYFWPSWMAGRHRSIRTLPESGEKWFVSSESRGCDSRMSALVESELIRKEDQEQRWCLSKVPALWMQGPEFGYWEPMLKTTATNQATNQRKQAKHKVDSVGAPVIKALNGVGRRQAHSRSSLASRSGWNDEFQAQRETLSQQ